MTVDEHLHGHEALESEQDPLRRRLIDAARQELAERGRVLARVSRIARRAQVSTGAIYSNFGSREQLLAAAYADRMGERMRSPMNFSSISPLLFRADKPDFATFYDELAQVCTAANEQSRTGTLDALVGAHFSTVTRDLLAPMFVAGVEQLATAIRNSQEAGYVRNDICAEAIAVNWIAAGLGVGSISALLRDPDDDSVNVATQQALFRLLTAYFIDRPVSPWDEPAAVALPLAVPPAPALSETPLQTALIASAQRELWASGNVEFNVSKVAADAGVTTGAMYSQFRDREGLIAAAYLARLRESVGADSGPGAIARVAFGPEVELGQLPRAIAALGQPGPRARRLSALEAQLEAVHNAQLRVDMRATTSFLSELMARSIESAQREGIAFADIHPLAVATGWVAATLGLSAVTPPFRPPVRGQYGVDFLNAFGVMLTAFRIEPWTDLLTESDIDWDSLA